MPLVPGYGDTPVPEAELAALLPHVIEALPKPITRAAIYDLGLSALSKVGDLMISAGRGALTLGDLLDEYFLRDTDQHRDVADLAAFVDIQPIEESNG